MSDKHMKLHVPKGFYTILEEFVQDLLKNQPEDVFNYGANFFEKLLQVRTDTGHDPAIHGPMCKDKFNNVRAKVVSNYSRQMPLATIS